MFLGAYRMGLATLSRMSHTLISGRNIYGQIRGERNSKIARVCNKSHTLQGSIPNTEDWRHTYEAQVVPNMELQIDY